MPGLIKTLLYLLFPLLLCSCAGISLRQRPVSVAPIKKETGTFNVILYGRETLHDVETIAILDRTGDAYEFKPRAPEYQYWVKLNLPAEQALNTAEEFLKQLIITGSTHTYAILGPANEILGYEIKPFFPEAPEFHKLSTDYRLLENNAVLVNVTWLDPVKPFTGYRRK